MRVTVLVAAAALVFGCVPEGDDDDGGGAGGMAGGGADEGPANEVNANIEGGAAAGPVSGSSEMSVPDQFHAAVFEGDLIVFLNSESGIIQFTVNTGEQQAPGSYTVIEDLGGQAHLTITSAGGIHMGTGGSIVVDQCPNDGGRITGRFDNVSLMSALTMAPDGTLSGSWAATVVDNDSSADCVPPPPPMMMGGGGGMSGDGMGPSPGPMCPNETCDGACCPLMPGLVTCTQGCFPSEPGMIPDFAELAACAAACEQVLLDDPNCGPRFRALTECVDSNMCERNLEDNPCLAANCCEEVTAAF